MFTSPRRSLALASVVLVSCGMMRTPYLLQAMNSGLGGTPVARPVPSERVSRLVQQHIQDSYFTPKENVVAWLDAVGKNVAPIAEQLACMRNKRPAVTVCYRAFETDAAATWGLPPVPLEQSDQAPTPVPYPDPRTLAEIDVERFMGNARWIAPSLLVLEDSLGSPLSADDVRNGIQMGVLRSREYLAARNWQRRIDRPSTALVMSGGGGTGAFTAGFVYRLMEVLEACHQARTCPLASIDLVVGTSTGSLIGVMVDLFQTKGHEADAKQLLLDSYTCSTEAQLYCTHDEWDWHLAEKLRGLMHFDGIENKLRVALIPEMQKNESELVTLAVDYDSGNLFAQSDQDPRDAADHEARVQTVLASIVEPVLSDPVDHLTSDGKRLSGTFIDAGVRSALPLREAVWRGAERTIVISTASSEIDPAPHPNSALPILMRTIDLSTSQNFVGEFQQAESEAVTRRLAEYDFCKIRLKRAKIGDANTVDTFCRRDNLWSSLPLKAQKIASGGTIAPGLFPEVSQSWQSACIHRPETSGPGVVGYTFDPIAMRDLFKWGVRTFQARCRESLALINVPEETWMEDFACGTGDVAFVEAKVAEAAKKFRQIESCVPKDRSIRNCK